MRGTERMADVTKSKQLKNEQILIDKFLELRKTALKNGVSDKEIEKRFQSHLNNPPNAKKASYFSWKLFIFLLLPCFLAAGVSYYVATDPDFSFEELKRFFLESRCLIDNNVLLMEIARPLTDCRMCSRLKDIDVLHNLTEKEFVDNYAYTGVPALVKGDTGNWSAINTFSYQYLKDLYLKTQDAFEVTENECQFFPYKTEFESLEEAFNMSEERAALRPGQKTWYFGWSNCHKDIAVELRKHYERPSFLPKDSESSSIDWIFMGWSGLGAFIHLDHVERPSWQAQISGTKTWSLIPPPECEDVCKSFNVTVEKGDIILVDTNQWYHSTFIHPGEMSITIGSEYD